jgi:hypothetical protein
MKTVCKLYKTLVRKVLYIASDFNFLSRANEVTHRLPQIQYRPISKAIVSLEEAGGGDKTNKHNEK